MKISVLFASLLGLTISAEAQTDRTALKSKTGILWSAVSMYVPQANPWFALGKINSSIDAGILYEWSTTFANSVNGS